MRAGDFAATTRAAIEVGSGAAPGDGQAFGSAVVVAGRKFRIFLKAASCAKTLLERG
jgi:hypothetical protein